LKKKLTTQEQSLIESTLDVIAAALVEYLPTQRSSKTSRRTRATDRGTNIRAAIRSGKSKASVRRQFKLSDYEYRGHKAAVTRMTNGK